MKTFIRAFDKPQAAHHRIIGGQWAYSSVAAAEHCECSAEWSEFPERKYYVANPSDRGPQCNVGVVTLEGFTPTCSVRRGLGRDPEAVIWELSKGDLHAKVSIHHIASKESVYLALQTDIVAVDFIRSGGQIKRWGGCASFFTVIDTYENSSDGAQSVVATLSGTLHDTQLLGSVKGLFKQVDAAYGAAFFTVIGVDARGRVNDQTVLVSAAELTLRP